MFKGDKRGVVAIALACGLFAAAGASAQAPSLGAAESFAVLASTTVTNTGPTLVQGNVGLTPGSAVTGFPPGTVVNGTININNASATQAKAAAQTAFTELNALPCDLTFGAGQDISALSPISLPGVYCFTSSAVLTGPVVIDAGGNPGAEFIFKIGSTLTAANNASVVVNGGSDFNVYWAVGSSATLGTNSTFAGNILALASITLNTGATASGGLYALNGAVTLDTNAVSACLDCATITLSPATLPNGTVNVAYSQAIGASGGTAPYTFAVEAGALPPGLTLTAGGTLSGTPTTAGTFNFAIQATDANGGTATQNYSLSTTEAEPVPAIGWPGLTLLMVLLGISALKSLRRPG